MEEARRYYNDNGRCALCTMMEEEASEATRVVYENAHYLVFVPYASGSPFETWIAPKRHTASFGDLADDEIPGLADALRFILRQYYFGLDNPDFNYVIRSVPRSERQSPALHWYIKLMPKLTKVAGFELGTGMFVNVTLPEENAKFLREFRAPEATPSDTSMSAPALSKT
jgi:UDPglucose--hexose-1-phosphate uridylyltransferase